MPSFPWVCLPAHRLFTEILQWDFTGWVNDVIHHSGLVCTGTWSGVSFGSKLLRKWFFYLYICLSVCVSTVAKRLHMGILLFTNYIHRITITPPRCYRNLVQFSICRLNLSACEGTRYKAWLALPFPSPNSQWLSSRELFSRNKHDLTINCLKPNKTSHVWSVGHTHVQTHTQNRNTSSAGNP